MVRLRLDKNKKITLSQPSLNNCETHKISNKKPVLEEKLVKL